MKKNLIVAACVVLAGSAYAQTTNFSNGHLVASAIDITISGSGATGAVSLKEFDLTPGSSPVSVVNFPSSGAGRFVYPWNTPSGFYLTYNAGYLALAGYDADASVLGISSSASADVARVVAKIPVSGTVSLIPNNTIYNGDNIRSVVTDGTDFWTGGTGSPATTAGVFYMTAGGLATKISQAPNPTNIRNVNVFFGDLYYSSSSGTSNGISKYTGMPTAPATASLLVGLTGGNCYDFVLTDPSTMYIADERALGSGGGILKYTFDGSAWNYAYSLNTMLPAAVRAITFLGNDGSGFAQLAVITRETVNTSTLANTAPSAIFKVTDGGAGLDTAVLLQTAPTNQNYRGLRFIPGGASNQTLSGSLVLNNTVGLFDYTSDIAYEVKQGATTLGSGTITAGTSLTSFTMNAGTATGAAHVILTGGPFLREVYEVNLTGANQNVGTFTMRNGNVVSDVEVGPTDIDAVIAAFGEQSGVNANCDRDAEVGPVDIDVVVANFGEQIDELP